jgi:hypothetical protein
MDRLQHLARLTCVLALSACGAARPDATGIAAKLHLHEVGRVLSPGGNHARVIHAAMAIDGGAPIDLRDGPRSTGYVRIAPGDHSIRVSLLLLLPPATRPPFGRVAHESVTADVTMQGHADLAVDLHIDLDKPPDPETPIRIALKLDRARLRSMSLPVLEEVDDLPTELVRGMADDAGARGEHWKALCLETQLRELSLYQILPEITQQRLSATQAEVDESIAKAHACTDVPPEKPDAYRDRLRDYCEFATTGCRPYEDPSLASGRRALRWAQRDWKRGVEVGLLYRQN